MKLAAFQWFARAFDEGVIECAAELRCVFDERMAAPRSSHVDRYVWDPWHVTHRDEDFRSRNSQPPPSASSSSKKLLDLAVSEASKAPRRHVSRKTGSSGTQYSMLRTPAASYFPEELFERLCSQLSAFGRDQLGCDSFTPPWLALYTDGAEMGWHTDAPHGPFAFVLSLTPDGAHARADGDTPGFFEGGETVILDRKILDYWRGFDGSRGLEFDDVVQLHDPQPFGRLLVFDGRLPHKVSRVVGTKDPRRGRLVLTGWFSDPGLAADGPLGAVSSSSSNVQEEEASSALRDDAKAALDAALDAAFEAFEACDLGRVVGFLALRFCVDADGSVDEVQVLCDTLVSDPAEHLLVADSATSVEEDGESSSSEEEQQQLDAFQDAPPSVAVKTIIKASLQEAPFPAAPSPTTITLPLSFN